MDTIGSARVWAARELRQVGVESATLTVDLLLGRVLGWERVQVMTRPEFPLPPEALERFQALVQRRVQGEPLQYLTGEQEFYGLRFRVAPDVLIPRPETEILVEQAVNLAGSLESRPIRFADVGTGSGCIAIAVAHEVPQAIACALDISLSALDIARENASRHAVLDRIQWLCCDVLEAIQPAPFFEMILSNPPYVANTEYNSLPATVRDYEPHAALFAGESGLEIYHRLVPQAAARLVRGGYLLVEIGLGQAADITQAMQEEGFHVERILGDLREIPRCVVARR